MHILSSKSYDIPIICVGNITIGGTGKTPVVEMLTEHYSSKFKVAVLSRGYGRKTRGYREVSVENRYRMVGDEPLQIKRKFPQVLVVVCEDRVKGIDRILAEHPDINMVIMDDGFQHRYVKPLINVITVDDNRKVQEDHLYPLGNLRDTLSSLHRAHCFVVTKCQPDMQPLQKRIHIKWLKHKAFQQVFFSFVHSVGAYPVFDDVTQTLDYGAEVIAMSGIGNNKAFKKGLESRYKVVSSLAFQDHHNYRVNDLRLMQQELAQHPNAVILTTEKDAVKIFNSHKVPRQVRERMFYDKIEPQFFDNGREELFIWIDDFIRRSKDGTLLFCS